MTILWIYDMPLVPEAGGTERITSLVAKGLRGLGHNCMDILVFNRETGAMTYNNEPVSDLYTFLKKHDVDIVINQIAYATWLLETFLRNGGDRWRTEGGKIISCLHFDPKPASALYYLRSIKHKTLRNRINIVKVFLFYDLLRRKKEKETGAILNWIYDNSDWYVILSETHFPYFKKVTKRKEYNKLRAINNPLTFDGIADQSVIDMKQKVVLVCSRMDEFQKRISLVLKAWRKIMSYPTAEGWTLKILGTGPDLEIYKEYTRNHNLKNVIFEGRQSPETYYREADIFLMTSAGIEGWGLTLTESLQNGVVPVVMNTCVVYSDIISHCYNGYLSDGSNLKSFTNYILALMDDERRLRAMQLNALRSAQQFTLSKTMEKWQEILK